MTELSEESDTTEALFLCEVCAAYLMPRARILAPAVINEAARRKIDPPLMALRYRALVHARHLAGLTLEVSQ